MDTERGGGGAVKLSPKLNCVQTGAVGGGVTGSVGQRESGPWK